MDVKPFLHEHYLLFDHYTKQEAICNKCDQHISSWAYNCETCNFWLHAECASQLLPSQISHPAHSQHSLTLHFDVVNFVCKGCFTLSQGHRYICEIEDCNFEIEVLCASSPTKEGDQRQGDRYKRTQHFIHYDPLTLCKYRKVKSEYHSCSWCDRVLMEGMCYGCFECFANFFVHESCLLSIPTRISKHPFHPLHTLYIQSVDRCYKNCNACKDHISGKAYHCRKCDFWLHYLCATSQPCLKHESHEHSLAYFKINHSRVAHHCNLCDETISGSRGFYSCVQCDFNLHLRCVPIPFTTRQKYHRHDLEFIDSFVEDDSEEYYCDICEEERNPKHPVYHCKKCKYVTHIQCAINKVASKALMSYLIDQEETDESHSESQTQLEIEHFNHQHPLRFYEEIEENENLVCMACNFEITSEAYVCESCKYYLHKSCTRLSHEVLHPIHPQHPLKLFANTDTFLCHQCNDFTIGFIYICYICDFMLDVKCAISTTPKTESQRLKEMERESKICFFNQGHHKPFYFNFRHKPDRNFKCSLCCLPISGPSYSCIECHYVVHESCLGFPSEIQVPVLTRHPLQPFVIGGTYESYDCYACRFTLEEHVIAFGLSSLQHGSHLVFHLACANSLRRPIESESHHHPLFYFGTECQKLFANTREFYRRVEVCGKCSEPFNGVPFYHCLQCDINFHLKCVPIPHSIESRRHLHPLVLKDYFAEDDSGEYYCDVCEQERDPNDHAYCCEECQGLFVSHIECVTSSTRDNLMNLHQLVLDEIED